MRSGDGDQTRSEIRHLRPDDGGQDESHTLSVEGSVSLGGSSRLFGRRGGFQSEPECFPPTRRRVGPGPPSRFCQGTRPLRACLQVRCLQAFLLATDSSLHQLSRPRHRTHSGENGPEEVAPHELANGGSPRPGQGGLNGTKGANRPKGRTGPHPTLMDFPSERHLNYRRVLPRARPGIAALGVAKGAGRTQLVRKGVKGPRCARTLDPRPPGWPQRGAQPSRPSHKLPVRPDCDFLLEPAFPLKVRFPSVGHLASLGEEEGFIPSQRDFHQREDALAPVLLHGSARARRCPSILSSPLPTGTSSRDRLLPASTFSSSSPTPQRARTARNEWRRTSL